MLEKVVARPSAADVWMPDLEDSVPVEGKPGARTVLHELLPTLLAPTQQARAPVVIPRVNSLDTEFVRDDIAMVLAHSAVPALSIGKIGSVEDVQRLERLLCELETQCRRRQPIQIVPWLETAAGIVNATAICASSRRILAVAFGADDLTADMGMPRLSDDSNLVAPRALVALAARAASVQAWDTPYVNIRDEEGLVRDSKAVRALGFTGKCAIHPNQVDAINATFSPSPDEIAHARRVVAAFEDAVAAGRASANLDGKMVDTPVYKRAAKLLSSI